jgi:hypothetical protein
MRKTILAALIFASCAPQKHLNCTVVSHQSGSNFNGKPLFITVVQCNGHLMYTYDLDAFRMPVGTVLPMVERRRRLHSVKW